ncbi:hypothetical protein MIND_00037600 [Mycena indigotica]|uniref:GIT Spa2 homology (SHD) domain-containing protein n=1 Tax=Mycena indigotica TaxID=2126181 RepID=A0A8H6TEE5_9AGAR|nr:uncharacterized protein MIND_00037600 [Mycena indigotica]KAF7315232.1 hypothetical protein MIND_00037600 [Mycena indigotica]
MKSTGRSRAPSPTGTTFSGISNYKTESYRPIRDKNIPPLPPIDYRAVSEIHFNELDRYLAAYLAKAPPNSRSSARQKLTRLTIQQFHELSTDVYDELIRRKQEEEVPFLPVREEFHPKRNQARQKLATLPVTRFEDLSSDVYFELSRRYPEFKEDPSGNITPGSNYDDYPASDFPSSPPPRGNGRASADRPSDSGYGGSSVSSRRPSEDRRRPSEEYGRRSADYNGRTSGDDNTYTSSISSRRKPSVDTTRRSDEREREYRPKRAGGGSIGGMSDSSNLTAQQQSTTAGNTVIIPNKSTIEEEYIEVPYGREARESAGSTFDDRDRGDADPEPPDTASDYPFSPQSPAGGLNALGARLLKDDDDNYNNFGRSSVDRDRGRGNDEDVEKVRQDYEYRIATMQSQISSLQRERDDAGNRQRQMEDSEARVQQLEDELNTVVRRAEEQTTAMRALQRELDDLRDNRQREKDREARRAQEDQDEIRVLREQLEEEREMNQGGGGGADPESIEQLRNDMEGLLTELSDLSHRNDELMSAKDSDSMTIRELESQLKEYKRKYEQAKTELRSFKATSQLFIQAPKMDRPDDQFPISAEGGIVDIHITAFLSAIDTLLTAGRSNAPSRVLSPMKAVVNAVSSIVDDVRAFEARSSRDRADVDPDALASLRERAEATLSNLVAASKTHATSAGMSPVSLLDAAASHIAVTVTEIARTVCVRKASRAEQDASSSTASPSPAVNGFSPSLRSVEESKPIPSSMGHQRKPSAAPSNSSARSMGASRLRSPTSPASPYDPRRRPPSDNSSSEKTNSPPPIFDQPTNESAVAEAEDAWAELKPYLEAQTESIVYAIQSVLSGVRSPTPSPTLNENLTQIITIVSSIVAVCNDNLPPATASQGNDILRELSDHANRLSEVQAQPEVTKESRQVMAKSSFAIANAMKGLMKLQ